MVHSARVEGSGWTVLVGGFRDVFISDVDDLLSRIRTEASPAVFQVFDADRVAGWRHLFLAAVNAVRAFEAGAPLSRSLAVEVLLYAACHDQIARAFEIVGVTSTTDRVALLVMARSAEEAEAAFGRASAQLGVEDGSALQVDEAKLEALRRLFSISDAELEAVGGARGDALTDLIVERGALLAAHR